MYARTAREASIQTLEEETARTRSEYIVACRELIRREELSDQTGDTRLASAAINCASKKRAFDRVSEKLRIARGGG